MYLSAIKNLIKMNNKKLIIGILIIFGIVIAPFILSSANNDRGNMIKKTTGFILPPLPYAYDALEPYIDTKTMELHYSRHHAAFVNNLNKALEGTPAINYPIEKILANISAYSVAVRNNAGGHYNHELFWNIMSPHGGGEPAGELAEKINSTFGSFNQLKAELTKAALGQFGSGWAWLILQDGNLKITSTPNQDNPLMDIASEKGFPLLAIDVWEHAYYLKYQNRRADYLIAFWNIVNWDYVYERYKDATEKGL